MLLPPPPTTAPWNGRCELLTVNPSRPVRSVVAPLSVAAAAIVVVVLNGAVEAADAVPADPNRREPAPKLRSQALVSCGSL